MFRLFGGTEPRVAQSAALVWMLVSMVCVAQAADEFSDLKVIDALPRTTAEMERLHRDSSGNRCEQIAEGQSLEMSSFSNIRTSESAREKNSRPASRQSIISVGLVMDSADRANLPLASRSRILDYMDENYVSIQVRVRRDLLDSKLYFHHKPLAATVRFRGSKVTQSFEPLVRTAVYEFRSVGLFTTNRGERRPEDLRTLVLMFKNTAIQTGARTVNQYEYAFIRGREGKDEDRLETHVFVTADQRSQLVYLNPYERPSRPDACSIRGSIAITDFDSTTGAIPRESATRSYRLDARRIFPMENIDVYCQNNKLEGGIYQHLDEVLDVLIDQMKTKR
ncbi:MAG: hypothetical protein IT423_12755 [Pirellulaceae bacterium]|nr:hypothetical protein [Pirellulaceae bacterium]